MDRSSRATEGTLSVAGVAERCGVSEKKVRYRHLEGLLPAVLEKPLRFDASVLDGLDAEFWEHRRGTRRDEAVAACKHQASSEVGVPASALLTRREVASLYDVTPSAVENWIGAGWLKPVDATVRRPANWPAGVPMPRLFLKADAKRASQKAAGSRKRANAKRAAALRRAAAARKGRRSDGEWLSVGGVHDEFGWGVHQIDGWRKNGWPVSNIRVRTRRRGVWQYFRADLQRLADALRNPADEATWLPISVAAREYAQPVWRLHQEIIRSNRWSVRHRKMPTRLADGRAMNVWRVHRGDLERRLRVSAELSTPAETVPRRGAGGRPKGTGKLEYIRVWLATAAAQEIIRTASRKFVNHRLAEACNAAHPTKQRITHRQMKKARELEVTR